MRSLHGKGECYHAIVHANLSSLRTMSRTGEHTIAVLHHHHHHHHLHTKEYCEQKNGMKEVAPPQKME